MGLPPPGFIRAEKVHLVTDEGGLCRVCLGTGYSVIAYKAKLPFVPYAPVPLGMEEQNTGLVAT